MSICCDNAYHHVSVNQMLRLTEHFYLKFKVVTHFLFTSCLLKHTLLFQVFSLVLPLISFVMKSFRQKLWASVSSIVNEVIMPISDFFFFFAKTNWLHVYKSIEHNSQYIESA